MQDRLNMVSGCTLPQTGGGIGDMTERGVVERSSPRLPLRLDRRSL